MREQLHLIQGATEEGRLVDPESLVEDLMLSEASDEELRQTLLGQVKMAVERAEGHWLLKVSGYCYRAGMRWCSEGWIERNIGVIPTWARRTYVESPYRPMGGACGHEALSTSQASQAPDDSRGACDHEAPSTSRASQTSDDGWTTVQPRKRARRVSPTDWEERKIIYGEGCFKCGEHGHYQRECPNAWKCRRCLKMGHVERYCPQLKATLRLTVTSTSGSGASEVQPRQEAQGAGKITERFIAPSTSGSSASERLPKQKAECEEEATASTSRRGVDVPERQERAQASGKAASHGAEPCVEPARRQGGVKRDMAGVPKEAEGPKRAAPKFKECPVPWCGKNFYYRKGHVFGCHYPTALAMEEGASSTSTDNRARVRVLALQYLARTLVGEDASVEDLVRFVNSSGVLEGREECQADDWTRRIATDLAREMGVSVPQQFTCSPINSAGIIFQYRIMLAVVSLLGEERHAEFLEMFSVERWPELPMVVEVDTEGRREVRIREERLQVSSTSAIETCEQGDVADSVSTVRTEVVKEAEVSSTSVGVQSDVEGDDGTSSISADTHWDIVAAPSNSEDESPRRPWLPEHSPELDLSEMVVVDEVEGEGEKEEVPAGEEELEGGASRRSRWEVPFRLECVDSHFHWDRLCRRIGIGTVEFSQAMAQVRPREGLEVEVDGAVAVWCDPRTYPTKRQVAKLRRERVVSVVGIHPGKVQEGDVQALAHILDTFEVVGLGEVGIDGTKEDPLLQRRILDETLGLLKSRPHLVLVLHCRAGIRDNVSSVYYEMFYKCKGILCPEQRIHLHCFNGNMEVVSLWLGYFPNTYFGYSLMVSRNTFGPDSRLAVRRLDATRILLETDAPYFPAAGEELSSPAFIGVTAREVAKVRGGPWKELMQQAADNARRLYWS